MFSLGPLYVCMCTRVCRFNFARPQASVCVCVCVFIHAYIRMYVYTYVVLNTYIHAYIHAFTYIYMHIYVLKRQTYLDFVPDNIDDSLALRPGLVYRYLHIRMYIRMYIHLCGMSRLIGT
jgi:hypothetical protein